MTRGAFVTELSPANLTLGCQFSAIKRENKSTPARRNTCFCQESQAILFGLGKFTLEFGYRWHLLQKLLLKFATEPILSRLFPNTCRLKRAGKEYKGLCPFHTDKHPSFYVNPDKGIYKCFSCGEGGHVIGFVQKIKKIEFKEAVRELAHRFGIQLVETAEARMEYDKRSLMLLLYEQAAAYFSRLLADEREGAIARDYLHKRGLDEEIISRFKLGFAPQTWDGLLNYLTEANKFTPATLEEAGLVRRKQDSNSFYDSFPQSLDDTYLRRSRACNCLWRARTWRRSTKILELAGKHDLYQRAALVCS